jgi:UDP-2,3-diacylglucosamine hydrolase
LNEDAQHFRLGPPPIPRAPRIVETFFGFLTETAVRAEHLYILGDLFEYWVGDDDRNEPFNASIAAALAALAGGALHSTSCRGTATSCWAGICAQLRRGLSQIRRSPDLYGTQTLVMHGDTLCTDDVDYQKFRAYAR